MSLFVQKFGGSSLASVEHIQQVANNIITTKKKGDDIVVVVSAMADETDQLIALANAIQPLPSPREFDQLLACGEQKSMALLVMALQNKGCNARSLTATQAGIHTNAIHGHARIVDIDTKNIKKYLALDEVLVVAGFQGMHVDEITTLGRGGSDLTAVALAAALEADECQIFTDVDGVYFADPRIVPKAKKLESVSFDEMIELSNLGTKVLHHRAVLLARKTQVPLRVLSSFSIGSAGTQIAFSISKQQKDKLKIKDALIEAKVTGIACQTGQALIELNCLNSESLLSHLTGVLGHYHLTIANISISPDNTTVELRIVLPDSLVTSVERRLQELLQESEMSLTKQFGLTQVSIVGQGIVSGTKKSEVFYRILELNSAKIRHTYSNELAISALLEVENSKKIVEALFLAFHLAPVEPVAEMKKT